MKLTNTTDLPNEVVKDVLRFVKPSGVSNFDVMLRNSTDSALAGRAYTQGSGYHSNASPFVVLRVPKDTHPRWNIEREDGKRFTASQRPWKMKGDKVTRINRPTYPKIITPYQYGQLKGKRYVLANRIECLVYIAAHELRHLWQAKAESGSKRRGMTHGARGRFSEIDTESYAIRMLRAWRREQLTTISVRSVDTQGRVSAAVTQIVPRLPDSEAERAAKRQAAALVKLTKTIERTTAALKRWHTKAKRADTAIKKLSRKLKRLTKTQQQKENR